MVVAILIIGALASIGYYQFEVARSQTSTSATTTSSTTVVTCTKTNCAYVEITPGADGCINPSSPCGFSPAMITVVIGTNNTVLWTNNDTALHTVTPDTGSAWGVTATCQSFGALGICPGGTYQYTFTAAGTYQYKCLYHPGMLGEVIVLASTTSTSSSSTS